MDRAYRPAAWRALIKINSNIPLIPQSAGATQGIAAGMCPDPARSRVERGAGQGLSDSPVPPLYAPGASAYRGPTRNRANRMQLSKFTDYAIRVLILAASHPDRNITIRETAEVYDISQAHLKKVVRHLSRQGLLASVRGHGGGFTLGMPAAQINLGVLIRSTETDFALVECFNPGSNCRIESSCRLPAILDAAMAAFLDVMDRHSLQDIALSPMEFVPPRPG